MAKKEDTKKPSKEVSDSDDLELVQDNDEFSDSDEEFGEEDEGDVEEIAAD